MVPRVPIRLFGESGGLVRGIYISTMGASGFDFYLDFHHLRKIRMAVLIKWNARLRVSLPCQVCVSWHAHLPGRGARAWTSARSRAAACWRLSPRWFGNDGDRDHGDDRCDQRLDPLPAGGPIIAFDCLVRGILCRRQDPRERVENAERSKPTLLVVARIEGAVEVISLNSLVETAGRPREQKLSGRDRRSPT